MSVFTWFWAEVNISIKTYTAAGGKLPADHHIVRAPALSVWLEPGTLAPLLPSWTLTLLCQFGLYLASSCTFTFLVPSCTLAPLCQSDLYLGSSAHLLTSSLGMVIAIRRWHREASWWNTLERITGGEYSWTWLLPPVFSHIFTHFFVLPSSYSLAFTMVKCVVSKWELEAQLCNKEKL